MGPKRGRNRPSPSQPQQVSPGFVAVGRVLAPRGLLGDFKVQPLTPFTDRFQPGRSLHLGGERRLIERAHPERAGLLLKLSGIDDKTSAEAFRDQYLEVPESDLQPLGEGQYYHFQLIGVSVRTTKGLPVGRVTRILSTPANDVLVVHGMLGELLVPAVEDVVKEIDLDNSVMVIEMIPGLVSKQKGKSKPA